VPAPARNKIGFHLLPGAPNAFLDIAYKLAKAGKPIPLVTALFVSSGARAFTVQQLRDAGIKTIIARLFVNGDYHADDVGGWNKTTRTHGQQYFAKYKHLISGDMARADFVQIADLNEPGEGTGINAWHHGILDGADDMGIKLACYNFSVGNPADLGFWQWQSTRDLLRRIKQYGHALCLHQYAFHDQWTNEDLIMRHLRIMPLLPPDLQDIPLYFNEFGESWIAPGTPAVRNPERYAARMRTAQAALSSGYNVQGAALWSLGDSGGWARDRLEGVLPEYERFAMEVG